MRYIFFLTAITFFILMFNTSSEHNSTVGIGLRKGKELKDLLDKKEYFKLRAILNERKDSLDETEFLYYNSFIQNVFNQLEGSNKSINDLLTENNSFLTDTMTAQLLQVKLMNYFNLYDYNSAYQTGRILIEKYANALDTIEYGNIKNFNVMLGALSEVPVQRVTFKGDAVITWKRDSLSYMHIPVKAANTEFDFFFDSGANLSTLSKSTARKIGLRILEGEIEGKGSTDINVRIEYGVADSIWIGPILIQNVIFAVLPDEQLTLPQLGFTINGIIGYPVMHQLKEIKFLSNGSMIIPENPAHCGLSDLALDGLTPVISIRTENDTLLFTFDSGAKKTVIYRAYFDKYNEYITKNGEHKKIKRSGVGGTVDEEVYTLINFNLYIGDKRATLPEVNVFTKFYEPEKLYYGRIGQDVISQFNEMIINFDDMYVNFN